MFVPLWKRYVCAVIAPKEWLTRILFPSTSNSLRSELTCEPCLGFLSMISLCLQSDATQPQYQYLLSEATETIAVMKRHWHWLYSHLSASKPKYTFDFSEEEEADEEENGDDDVTSSPVRSLKDDFTSSEPKERYNDHNDDDEDDDNDNEVSYSPIKQKPT